MAADSPKEQIVHFAPSMKAMRQIQPMCGCIGLDDDISTDPRRCTCQECRDWIEAPSEATGAGVTGHD